MIQKENIELVKKQLSIAYSSYMDKIIDKTKLSRPTVSKFFNYQKIRPENAIKIYDEALRLLKKKTLEHHSRIAKTQQLTKNFPHL